MNDIHKVAKQAKKRQSTEKSKWCYQLKENPLILGLVDSAQEILSEIDTTPAIDAQCDDISVNLRMLEERPLTALQTHRLNQAIQQNPNSIFVLETFEKFHAIWEPQIVMTDFTFHQLHPTSTPPYRDNAATSRYKSYLEHMLFILLCMQHVEKSELDDQLISFVQWMNRVYCAATTAKISVREKPSIDSQIITELPKHSAVTLCNDEDLYWKKVTIPSRPEITGYVISAYLKLQQR